MKTATENVRDQFRAEPFGKWMAKRRISLGLTQQELADAVGVTRQYISWLEGPDASMPRPRVMQALLRELESSGRIRVDCPVGEVMVLTSEILTVREAAAKAKVSTSMIYAAVAEGSVRSYALSKRNIRIKAADLEAWLDGHEQQVRQDRMARAMEAFGPTHGTKGEKH